MQGDQVNLYAAFNEQDEAYFVVEKIKQAKNEGKAFSDHAILYRVNAQSRLFEERLMLEGIPYRVYGGFRFFERAEIKNTVAYLRLIANRHDDASFERVVNFPTRGIGLKTLEIIRKYALNSQCSLWQAAVDLISHSQLSSRSITPLKQFLQLIKTLSDSAEALILADKIKLVIETSGLQTYYQQQSDAKTENRLENLAELINAASLFKVSINDQDILTELELFLNSIALETGERYRDQEIDCVQLMTLHSAKGLEFEQVFVVGLEDNLFPSSQSLYEPNRLEEERRLFYVGITRAMRHLYLSYSESRWWYGQENNSKPSRFLSEIPLDSIKEVRLRSHTHQKPALSAIKPPSSIETDYKVNQKVQHPKFGEGIILKIEGEGMQRKIQIRFEETGIKWLMLSYAKLT
ncbi:MAG: hypothetical protein RL637_1161 [Pseudomonadota bacterium]|jgi:DNA helicase-2/ATP-dependent DNA helicase PcrA